MQDGLLGKIKEVHSWQGRPRRAVPRAIERPTGTDPVPTTVQLDLWLGAAPVRPYVKEMYHPINWRGWQDFGTGQLGDFGCHIHDPVFTALKLTSPTRLTPKRRSSTVKRGRRARTVRYLFPGTEYTAAEVPDTWNDGEGHHRPARIVQRHPGVVSSSACRQRAHRREGLARRAARETADALPRSIRSERHAEGRRRGPLRAIRRRLPGRGQDDVELRYAGPLTETVLLGVIGIRNPGEELQWDAAKLTITNNSTANGMVTNRTAKAGNRPGFSKRTLPSPSPPVEDGPGVRGPTIARQRLLKYTADQLGSVFFIWNYAYASAVVVAIFAIGLTSHSARGRRRTNQASALDDLAHQRLAGKAGAVSHDVGLSEAPLHTTDVRGRSPRHRSLCSSPNAMARFLVSRNRRRHRSRSCARFS